MAQIRVVVICSFVGLLRKLDIPQTAGVDGGGLGEERQEIGKRKLKAVLMRLCQYCRFDNTSPASGEDACFSSRLVFLHVFLLGDGILRIRPLKALGAS